MSWSKLTHAHDRIFSTAKIAALKHLTIRLGVLSFAVHLALICLVRHSGDAAPISGLIGTNYLYAISTPFSIILFYEVLTLIAAVPASTTKSILNQFEVVSLIYASDIFKDLAVTSQAGWNANVLRLELPLLIDMTSVLLMFLCVAAFQIVASKLVVPVNDAQRNSAREKFISQKKVVAVCLTILLLVMAAYNLFRVLTEIYRSLGSSSYIVHQPLLFFYHDVFTVMIFTDVLILILSLVITGQYAMVFRNAAFVLSIILLRIALMQQHPYGGLLIVFSMIFGVIVLLIFNLHQRVAVG